MIGVLGGMGPLATVDFLAKVIAATPATCDQQHVPMMVHQVPQIPDRSTAILAGSAADTVLATRGTHRTGIYASRLGEQFAQLTIDESVQLLVDEAIAAVKAGASAAGSRAAGEAVERLLANGADRLILGCTELPVALRDHAHWDRCVDTTLALARLSVRESFEN